MSNPFQLKTIFLSSLILFASGAVNADPLFDFKFNAPNNAQNSANLPQGGPNPVMTPDDFQKTVNDLGQQNLNNLSQQVNQQMERPLGPAPLSTNPSLGSPGPSLPPAAAPTVATPESPTSAQPSALPANPPPPEPGSSTQAKEAPSAQTQPAETAGTTGTEGDMAAPTEAESASLDKLKVPEKSPQSQPYTGFNFNNQNNGSGTATQPASTGGFNIKY